MEWMGERVERLIARDCFLDEKRVMDSKLPFRALFLANAFFIAICVVLSACYHFRETCLEG